MKGRVGKACGCVTWLSIFAPMTNCLSVKSHTHTWTNIILSLYVDLGETEVVGWEAALARACLLPQSRGDADGKGGNGEEGEA